MAAKKTTLAVKTRRQPSGQGPEYKIWPKRLKPGLKEDQQH